MSFSTIISAAVQGVEVRFVCVEADVSNGLPMLHMVGYLSSEVKEAGERVRTAIRNAGYNIPAKRIVINLAPVEVRKRGASFDLPMAVALLVSMSLVQGNRLKDTLIIGELSLDGSVRRVSGVLPIVDAAKKEGVKTCIVPIMNLKEGKVIEGINIIGVSHLKEVCEYLNGSSVKESGLVKGGKAKATKSRDLNYSEVKGQKLLKRATEIAVSGKHNILYIGPPGSGKTMIAKRIPTILPSMSKKEQIEITKIYSVLGKIDSEQPLLQDRPFRNVHHTITKAALIGGGRIPVPGELSLAHEGVLFLDELTEFQKSVIEVLRQPIEEKEIKIIRSQGNYVFPADAMIVSAMNPCPCGNYPDYNKCRCTEGQIRSYLSKVSGPFLDRTDICVEAIRVDYETLVGEVEEESSEVIRERVRHVREIQKKRYTGIGISTNEQMGKLEIEKFCKLTDGGEEIMKKAFTKLSLTARSYYKILKVARTIADMDGCDDIAERHLREAIGYRVVDRKFWGADV